MVGFYTFKQAADTPFFEEPDKVREIRRAHVLTGTDNNGLADPQQAISPSLSWRIGIDRQASPPLGCGCRRHCAQPGGVCERRA